MGTSLESSSGIVASYCTMSNWGCPPNSGGSIEDELTPGKKRKNIKAEFTTTC